MSKPQNKPQGVSYSRKYNVRARSQGVELTFTINVVIELSPQQAFIVAASRAAYCAEVSQLPWDPFNATFILTI